jgi:DNA-binding FadR family transcriptional regulator
MRKNGSQGGQAENIEADDSPKNASLSHSVYEQMILLIMNRPFLVNSKLPSENELAKQFQVSRPILRAALERLRVDGLIISRRGSGSYVLRQPNPVIANFAPTSSIADIQECFTFRIGLESEAAYYAALLWDKQSFAAIKASLSVLEQARTQNILGVDADYDFHCAIAAASKNRFMISTMGSLRDHIVFGMNLTRSLSLMRPAERLLAVWEEHHSLFKAIEARDADAARTLMRNHLESARRRVFEGEFVKNEESN